MPVSDDGPAVILMVPIGELGGRIRILSEDLETTDDIRGAFRFESRSDAELFVRVLHVPGYHLMPAPADGPGCWAPAWAAQGEGVT